MRRLLVTAVAVVLLLPMVSARAKPDGPPVATPAVRSTSPTSISTVARETARHEFNVFRRTKNVHYFWSALKQAGSG